MNKNSRGLAPILIVVILGLIALVGYLVFRSTSAPSLFPSPTPTPSISPAVDNWIQHNDRVLNFSIRFPPGWYLYPASPEGFGSHTILTNYDTVTADPDETGQRYLKGNIAFEFGYHPTPYDSNQDLTEWAKQNFLGRYAQGEYDGPSIIEENQIIISSFRGKKLITIDGNKLEWVYYFIPRGEKVFILSAGPLKPEVDQILSTFKFLN